MNLIGRKFKIELLLFLLSVITCSSCFAINIKSDVNQSVTNIYSTQDNPALYSYTSFNAAVCGDLFSLQLGGFYVRSTNFHFSYEEATFYFDPINIWNFNLSLDYTFDRGNISASGAMGSSDFIGTDLYYLYKKNTYFKSEYYYFCSIDGSFDDAQLNLLYAYIPLAIENYDRYPFGNAEVQFAGGLFKYKFFPQNFDISCWAGDIFLWQDLNFSATYANQNYSFFPYIYYTIAESGTSNVVFAGVSFLWNIKNNIFSVKSGAALISNFDVNSNINYLYKKNLFYDGSSGSSQEKNNSLQNNGIVFCDLSYSYQVLNTAFPMEFYADKVFIVPFNLEKNINEAESNFDIVAYLLSGITFGVKFIF